MSGKLQSCDWLFLSLQKACNCASVTVCLLVFIAFVSLAWYWTTWKLSENGWGRTFVSPLGKHLSPVMYSPKFSKQDDKEGNRIKRRKLVCGCLKNGGQKSLLAVPISVSIGSELFSVWTFQMHLPGTLGYVLWVKCLQPHFCCCTLICRNAVSKNGWVRNDKALLGSLEILMSRWVFYYLHNWILYLLFFFF